MTKLLTLTDLHITPHGETIIGLDTHERLVTTLTHAVRHHPDAAALILMGDLAHHGDAASYARLATALRDLPFPVIPMLGNHDRREAFLTAFPDAPRDTAGFIQQITDFPHHRVITLDTLDGPPYPPRHHAGRLCALRTAWCETALQGADKRMSLVFAHHPPCDTGIIGMDLIKLADGDRFLDQLARFAPVHLFCGHIHRTISGSHRGVPWTMFKSPAHQGVLDMTNPDSSLSVDEPPGYGVILLQNHGVVAHNQDVFVDQNVMRDAASALT